MSESLTVDALIDRYAIEGREEFAAEEAAREAERDRLHAAFEAGATLETLKPLEIWDPIDQVAVPLKTGSVLTVADHEGDILIGQLSDNSHSIGVLFEEAHRWYTRKYFLPLALLCDPVYIRTDAEAEASHRGDVKGLEYAGVDGETAVAIKRLEDLALRDDAAIIPRGTKLLMRKEVHGKDPETGRSVRVPAGSVALMVEAIGDTGSTTVDDFPDLPVSIDGRRVDLPFEVLQDLDPEADVLTLREQEKLADAEANRRRAMRRMFGIGLGVAALATDATLWVQNPDEKSTVLSLVIPELALVYGYFSAGGAYWHELHGLAMDLKGQGCAAAVRALGRRLDAIDAETDRLYDAYRGAYYRRVHTHWNETRHYRTDKDGRRHYTHSTWSKGYTSMWVEPSALDGDHSIIGEWYSRDEHRRERGERLSRERIFDLLEADDDAERSFHLEKMEVGFARDASISALCATLFSLPPSFYDLFIDGFRGRHDLRRQAQARPYQKPGLLLTGAIVGVVLAERSRRRHAAELSGNKYELGGLVESELKRVPGLSFVDAWNEFFGGPAPRNLTASVTKRRHVVERVANNAIDFSYRYGSGWDNGRRLDSIHVDSGNVRAQFQGSGPNYPRLAADLEHFLQQPAHIRPLHTVLKNACGTEILDGQTEAHEDEAKGNSLKRAGWFALPVWGAALVDLLLKAGRS